MNKRYTKQDLEAAGFKIDNDFDLTVRGDWVGTDESDGGGTVDLTVEYLFHAEPNEEGVWEIDDGHYAIQARVLSIDFWDGDGPPPFEVGEIFDTLDDVTFGDCYAPSEDRSI